MPQNPVLDELRRLVFSFKNTIPIVVALRNQNMKDYHWEAIQTVLGHRFELSDEFTLRNLIEMNADQFMEEIQEISN